MKATKIIFLAPVLCLSCASNTIVAPIPLDQTNYVFDFNQNGKFEMDEYQSYLEYKRTGVVPDAAVDTNHDGKMSYAEIKRMMDCLRSGPPKDTTHMLEELKKIPGVTIQRIEKDPEPKTKTE